jgi:manganese/iron transport system substrate-binding protein
MPGMRRLDFIASLSAFVWAPAGPALRVMTTTATLASLAQGVAGDRAQVSSLVPIGASPETYQPTPGDIARLRQAQVLVANGAGLEEWLAHTIAAAAAPHLVRVVCTDGLPVVAGNPHLWMDPVLARAYVAKIRDAFIAADPAGRSVYERNARDYDGRLVALVARTHASIATIPASRREMLVFHDAWSYYNRRFGLRTLGVIETSPGREPNPADFARLIDLARSHHVRAVFTEPEYNPKLVQTLARSAGITTVAVLYDDSLGPATRLRDYISMIDYDTGTIVASLR